MVDVTKLRDLMLEGRVSDDVYIDTERQDVVRDMLKKLRDDPIKRWKRRHPKPPPDPWKGMRHVK